MAHSAYPTPYMAARAGTATVSPRGKFEAGSFHEFTVTYTAGYFGIDDTGSLKIVHRFASDMGKPQFSNPRGANYTTAVATNGAVLSVQYDGKLNVRPWDKTLFIRVVKGFLREGDQITVTFGDRSQGSPGMRVQTFCEPTFEFKVLVDPWATYTFVELPDQPTISVVAGPAVTYKAVAPTLVRAGQRFRLGFKGEDKWGNPSDQIDARFTVRPSMHVRGLPEVLAMAPGQHAVAVEGLQCDAPGLLTFDVFDAQGRRLARSNPVKVSATAERVGYWADLHGQSEETIGTNSARELIEFARDRAFLDVMSHQGNDFQITLPFWNRLNELTAEYNQDGRFIIFPGYEWSGNTGLGGDRNVMFAKEGCTIHRSHHALVEDLSDQDTDAFSASELFQKLEGDDCLVFAHIGGRYADIGNGHDVRIERSVELHSDWGTFEWLLEDAFTLGYRVGILANSDGHKGRHGASHPGASLFGAYGGLSCLLANDLSRTSILEALRKRRHYATTGSRVALDLTVHTPGGAELFSDDPQMGGTVLDRVSRLAMGDIARYHAKQVEFQVELHSTAPIDRLEIRNRMQTVQTFRPEFDAKASRRVLVVWEGSEYRGRGRQTIWDGSLELRGNGIQRVVPINWWNLDKGLDLVDAQHLQWDALTTGGFGGVELWLDSPGGGSLSLDTALVKMELAIDDIGAEHTLFEAGGLSRCIRVYRLPEVNTLTSFVDKISVPLNAEGDNALYLRAVMEDGHLCWSSPVYLIA